MTRIELAKVEKQDGAGTGATLRPRDAATLILLDRVGDEIHVLMGRRHERHVFMPNKYVFPGGRTDPADSRIAVAQGLDPIEEERLRRNGARSGLARARAIALSAVRETYEEAGLLIGRKGRFQTSNPGWQGFSDHGVQPSLEMLRLVARAITPPGRVRRYDTRFLACWKSDVVVTLPEGGPTDELGEILWLPIGQAKQMDDIPSITRTVLGDLETRLLHDPLLSPGGAAAFYRFARNRFTRESL